jgi:cytochrome b
MRSVPIWDLPTRLCHWVLALLVGLGLVLGDDDPGLAYDLHAYAGYGVLFVIGFRVPWGFIGSRHSRFSDFVVSWTRVKAHARALVLDLEAPRSVGHNPLGGWMIVVLLAVTLLTALTGLFAGDEEAAGPYAAAAGWLSEPLGALHEALADLLIPLIVLHVVGVLVHWLLSGENVIRAMIDGHKDLDADTAAAEPRLVRTWRALAVLVVVAFLGGYVIAAT